MRLREAILRTEAMFVRETNHQQIMETCSLVLARVKENKQTNKQTGKLTRKLGIKRIDKGQIMTVKQDYETGFSCKGSVRRSFFLWFL